LTKIWFLAVFKNVLDLSERLSSKQVARLKAAGIRTLYDLITYLPSGVYRILPLSKFDREAIDRPRYLDQAILQKVIEKQTRRRFLLLEWRSQVTNWTYQTYFFSLTKFTLKSLRVGEIYQLLLVYQNNFWNLEKYSLYKTTTSTNQQLVLGSSVIKDYVAVYYSQLGGLNSNFFKLVHNKLLSHDYILNLTGLVLPNDIFPVVINLEKAHKPTNYQDYKNTLDHWISFQVYLKIATNRFLSQQTQEQFGLASKLDLNFLKSMSQALPFTLSDSQKLAIWQLLQDLQYPN
jgi:RecG-like helicase